MSNHPRMGARAVLILSVTALMLTQVLLVPIDGEKVGAELDSPMMTSAEEVEHDFENGGFHILTNEWWEPGSTVRYNVTADDSDGDGWNNTVDPKPWDISVPVAVQDLGCQEMVAHCNHAMEGFGGSSEPDYTVRGGYSRDLSLGDFDNDGDLDLARADMGKVGYFLNDNGTIQSNRAWMGALWRDSTAVKWADIDGDGDLDLTQGNSYYTFEAQVDIHLNENKTFDPYPDLRTQHSLSVHELEWADLTGDEHLDLVIGSLNGYLLIYLNYGTGFRPPSDDSCSGAVFECIDYDIGYQLSDDIQDLDLSDVDNDGDLDIFVANSDGVNLLINDLDFDGSFRNETMFNPTEGELARHIALGDIDEDGFEDLIVGGESTLKAFWNQGGWFNTEIWWESNAVGTSGGLEAADMDGDGDLDLIAGMKSQTNMVFINRNGELEKTASWQTAEFTDTLSLEVGDINGDGLNDIIFGNADIDDEVYLNHRRAIEKDYSWSDGVLASTRDVESADINGDGFMDLYVANSQIYLGSSYSGDGRDKLYLGSEEGLSKTPVWESLTHDWSTAAEWFDYDGDGDLDIYVGRAYDVIYRNDDGNLSAEPVWTSQYGTYTSDVAIADFDGNGEWDIAVSTRIGEDHVYLCCNSTNEPVLSWTSQEEQDQSVGVAAGDIDGDGFIDLVFASGNKWGRNPIFINNLGSDPQSTSLFNNTTNRGVTSVETTDVQLGDLNGDGRVDIVCADNTFANSVYLSNTTVPGEIDFYKVTTGSFGFTYSVDIADIDGDGDLDAVWGNVNKPSNVVIWEDGEKVAQWQTSASLSTMDIEIFDADGDGSNDIYAANGGGLFENVVFTSGTDADGDFVFDEVDAFPLDPTQAVDDDDDGYGDHINGMLPDSCSLYRGDSWRDRWGCPDMDGDGQSDLYDAFITQPTQWSDVDGDGFGDNWVLDGLNETRPSTWPGQWIAGAYLSDPSPFDFDNDGYEDSSLQDEGAVEPFDVCPLRYGASSEDVHGCIDSDGDGWSDDGDDMPNEPTQHLDSDGDGWGDDPDGVRADMYPNDPTQWVDTDGDGYGDSQDGNNADVYPLDPSQYADTDGDGYGDTANGSNPDACPGVYGTSFRDVLGCIDVDGDGWSNLSDVDDDNAAIWSDLDGDGFYDQPGFSNSDDCVNQAGTSLTPWRGCSDRDSDGIMDLADLDADGDGVSNNDELQAGGAEGVSYDIYNPNSRPKDLDKDGVPDSLDEDRDGDGFPDDFEKSRGSDPGDADSTPMNLYGDADTGLFYVPGEGFKSTYDENGYEISVSFLIDMLTSEMLIPILMIPVTVFAVLRKRLRYRSFRKRLDNASSMEDLEGAEEALDSLITKRKLKVEQAMLLRNQMERLWADYEEEDIKPAGSALDFGHVQDGASASSKGRY